MAEVLDLHGFKMMDVFPRFLPYTMSNEKTPPLFFVKLYLRLRIIWPLFGKQFLIIAKKP